MHSLRSAEQRVVRDEIDAFEASHPHAAARTTKTRTTAASSPSASFHNAPPPPAATAAAAAAAPIAEAASATRSSRTQRGMAPPFSGATVHSERSALAEARRVREAAGWLRECPSRTLQQLQQRVLCSTETLFQQLVGMPKAARMLLQLAADPNERSRGDSSSGEGRDAELEAAQRAADAYLTPPPPLTFTEFIGTLVRETPAQGTSSSSSSSTTVAPAFFHGVLRSGRQQPAAPLSSLHLVYGLHAVEEALRASPPPLSTPAGAAASGGLESHQALLSEVVHWAHFFERHFDAAREGLCRDPVGLYVAVLLACAERGAWELHNSPEAIAEEAVRHLRLDDGASGRRPHVCTACRVESAYLAASCRTYVRETMRTMRRGEAADAKGRRGPTAPTRFFLATPAVVLWAAAFLRLYRLRSPVVASTLTTTPAAAGEEREERRSDDTVSTAEVYLIRDWIAQAAKMDRDGFLEQERDGSIAIPLTCATNAPVAVFAFTPENVEAAVRRITAWADRGVVEEAPLSVHELLSILQDDIPVVPYYLSFFKA